MIVIEATNNPRMPFLVKVPFPNRISIGHYYFMDGEAAAVFAKKMQKGIKK